MRRRLTDRERVLRAVPEHDWLQDVIEKAEWLGWDVMHIYDSRRTKSEGWPDLILCRPPRIDYHSTSRVAAGCRTRGWPTWASRTRSRR